uniref:Uncharacterized protein n=1 Tax=Oryza sativa subsp. japonica TaxID=39947 RepID=Q5TKD6_ORYSJ|nr:hypothetical protein [Oryza sativa Japonica Group]
MLTATAKELEKCCRNQIVYFGCYMKICLAIFSLLKNMWQCTMPCEIKMEKHHLRRPYIIDDFKAGPPPASFGPSPIARRRNTVTATTAAAGPKISVVPVLVLSVSPFRGFVGHAAVARTQEREGPSAADMHKSKVILILQISLDIFPRDIDIRKHRALGSFYTRKCRGDLEAIQLLQARSSSTTDGFALAGPIRRYITEFRSNYYKRLTSELGMIDSGGASTTVKPGRLVAFSGDQLIFIRVDD